MSSTRAKLVNVEARMPSSPQRWLATLVSSNGGLSPIRAAEIFPTTGASAWFTSAPSGVKYTSLAPWERKFGPLNQACRGDSPPPSRAAGLKHDVRRRGRRDEPGATRALMRG